MTSPIYAAALMFKRATAERLRYKTTPAREGPAVLIHAAVGRAPPDRLA
ncbi:hypothetical protein [Neotabrizicola sp. sgz301269]